MKKGYVGVSRIANFLNTSESNITYRISTGKFPKPDTVSGKKNYWKVDTVRKYFEEIIRENEKILKELAELE
jgi:hypothetical protein